ncbi:MAG: DnaT-like ssDNA-binding protein [Pseudomonadota bacterium]
MALVVEDGTGKADAESLASVAAFKAHCDGRGLTYGADSAVEILLRKGTDYLGQAYHSQLAGRRVSSTQALDWPRYEVPRRDVAFVDYYPSDAIPPEVVKACIEAALRADAGELSPDLSQAVKREKVGQIETEYQDFSTGRTTYPVIDSLMAPFLRAAGGLRLTRS